MLFDTSIIINHLRGDLKATKMLENCRLRHISEVTAFEVISGSGKKFKIHYEYLNKSFIIMRLTKEIRKRTIAMDASFHGTVVEKRGAILDG
ncbi:MAG: hypothetical protein LBT74_02555 [Acidobacteriota bacterium]|jgi:predicted nucleic acid-binding protein|nr:hypothetical protein [Acidobacteriota bacterium]